MTSPDLGDEFDELASAFNQMAQRLQSVDSTRRQLFGDLAHEIRTPVSVLEAYLEAVEDGVKTLDPQTISVLREQTARLVRFSADAAALAQADEAHMTIRPEWVDAGELLGAAAAAVADRYAAKGSPWSLGSPAPPTVGRPATPRPGAGQPARQRLCATPVGRAGHLAAAPAGAEVVLTVGDDGEGIAAERLPHVFERFYSADTAGERDRRGAGIGLAIARA